MSNPDTTVPPVIGYRVAMGDESAVRNASSAKRWTSFFAAPFIWAAPGILLIGLVAALTGLIWMPNVYGWILAPFVTLLMLQALWDARLQSRRRNGRILLGYLETAARLNLPLPHFLAAAAQSETRRRRRQLQTLRGALEAGLPVAAALQTLADVPEEDVQTLAAMEAVGRLRSGLAQLAERNRRADADQFEQDSGRGFRYYPVYVLLLSFVVVVGLAILIVPKFGQIFKDFKTPLPPAMQVIVHVSDTIMGNPVLFVLCISLAVLAIALPITLMMQRLFLPFWPMPRFQRLINWLKWRTPFLRGMEHDAGMAAACDLLADALGAGVTLPGAASQAAGLPMNPALRTRWDAFVKRLHNGEDAAAAASGARLSPLLAGMLATSTAAGQNSAPAMFAFLARYYRQKFSRTVVFLRAASGPVAVMAMGAIVLTILYAVISSLIVLVQSAMPENLL